MFKSRINKQSLTHHLKRKLTFNTPQLGYRERGRGLGQCTLPRTPTRSDESLMRQSLKENLPSSSNELVESYGDFFLEYSIMAEFNHLQKTKLPGVYVIPSFDDPLVWFGVFFIRQGIYEDGVFRFTMNIPSNYPDGDCPSIYFTPPIFHPYIDPTSGKVDIHRKFSSWNANVNHIWQILLYLRRLFYKFDNLDPLNFQAAELFSDIEAYRSKVRDNISEINSSLYNDNGNDDPHAFRFREWNPELHEKYKKYILKDDEDSMDEDGSEKPKLSGLSFLEPGTNGIFLKEN